MTIRLHVTSVFVDDQAKAPLQLHPAAHREGPGDDSRARRHPGGPDPAGHALIDRILWASPASSPRRDLARPQPAGEGDGVAIAEALWLVGDAWAGVAARLLRDHARAEDTLTPSSGHSPTRSAGLLNDRVVAPAGGLHDVFAGCSRAAGACAMPEQDRWSHASRTPRVRRRRRSGRGCRASG